MKNETKTERKTEASAKIMETEEMTSEAIKLTELVFILDRSGSMEGLEEDTIGGFNSMLERQKKQEGDCYVSTILFHNRSEVLHDRVKLSEVERLTEEDYTVGGGTALIDAIGGAIHHIRNIHKYARKEDVPAHTMFVILTDGMENASRQYRSDEVKQMIEQEKEEHGWEFLFIGANIDAVETAAGFGIDRNRAVNYHADKKGTRTVYEAVAGAVSMMRAAPVKSERPIKSEEPLESEALLKSRELSEQETVLDDSWRQKIEQDYEARKDEKKKTDAEHINRRGRRGK